MWGRFVSGISIMKSAIEIQVQEATIAEIKAMFAEAQIEGEFSGIQYFAIKALEALDIDVAKIVYLLREAQVENCHECSETEVRSAFLIWFSFFVEQEMQSVIRNIEDYPKDFRKHLKLPVPSPYEPTEQELEEASDYFNGLQSPEEYAKELDAEMNPELNPDRYKDLVDLGLGQIAEV